MNILCSKQQPLNYISPLGYPSVIATFLSNSGFCYLAVYSYFFGDNSIYKVQLLCVNFSLYFAS